MGGSVKPCIHNQLAENVCILRGGKREGQGGEGKGAVKPSFLLAERAR